MDLKNISMPNLKKMDKKLLARMVLVLVIIVVIFLVVIIAKLLIGNRVGYTSIEEKMVSAAKKYYATSEAGMEKFKDVSKGEIAVSVDTLVEEKFLTPLEKIVPNKDIACKGQVKVKMNNGYALYTPELDCGDTYKTKKLVDVITATTVEEGIGLYEVDGEYIFRGETKENFVSFAGKTWMILRVTKNGTIRMIETTRREKVVWDNRYNLDSRSTNGINDFDVSRIKDKLLDLYNNPEEFTDADKAYINPYNLCIGKRAEEDTSHDGSTECSQVIEDWYLGLLRTDEYLIASLDTNCQKIEDSTCKNYNFLAYLQTSYWSITANSKKSYKVYKFNPEPFVTNASNEGSIRAVIELDNNAIYVGGSGTENDPYILK